MKNPFRSDRPDHERDNPLVPNAIERPVERAINRAGRDDHPLVPDALERPVERMADRAEHDHPLVPNALERPVEAAASRGARHDNPLIPNAVERPVERAAADDRGAVIDRLGIGHRDIPDDGRGTSSDLNDGPAGSRAHAAANAPVADRPLGDNRPGDRPGITDRPATSHGGATTSADDSRQIDLFPGEELAGYRTQWESIQTGFVDEPRAAVEQADALVSQMATRLTELFARERSTLEGQWTQGDNVSTEDLRVALTRYRSFFHRLLSM